MRAAVRRAAFPGRCAWAAVLLLLGGGLLHPAFGMEISGSRSFTGEVVVPKGETWKVLPGATVRFRGGRWIVRGRLIVEGTAERPVRIVGDDAFEGLDIRGEDGSAVAHAVISGGSRGAAVTNASAAFRQVRWEKNGIGLDVGQYAKATVSGCAFDSPFRVGVLVKRGGEAAIVKSRFAGAGKAGVYVFGAMEVSVAECLFERNTAGVHAAMFGARVAVAGSAFKGNGTGLIFEKMAEPSVTDCDVSENRVGLLFSRRAEGSVSKSRIVENGDGVVVEFSSYPVFRGNLFRGNRGAAVRLIHQSSEWEEELGDTGRESPAGPGGAPFGGAPGGRGDFRPGRGSGPPGKEMAAREGSSAGERTGGPPGRKESLTGTVDFRGNDWGDLAPEVSKGGNVSGIHDGRDEPTFEYKGKRYRMDSVLLQ